MLEMYLLLAANPQPFMMCFYSFIEIIAFHTFQK